MPTPRGARYYGLAQSAIPGGAPYSAEPLQLPLPLHQKTRQQIFQLEFRRLPPSEDRLHDLRRKQREPQHPAHLWLCAGTRRGAVSTRRSSRWAWDKPHTCRTTPRTRCRSVREDGFKSRRSNEDRAPPVRRERGLPAIVVAAVAEVDRAAFRAEEDIEASAAALGSLDYKFEAAFVGARILEQPCDVCRWSSAAGPVVTVPSAAILVGRVAPSRCKSPRTVPSA